MITLLFSPQVIRDVRNKKLTFLEPTALIDIYKTIRKLEHTHTSGLLIEAGCALGGSAILIAKAKSTNRPFYVYDVFGMIPSPSENDGADAQERYKVISSGQAVGIKHDTYYGYESDLLKKVSKNFTDFDINIEFENVHFIKGLFQETLFVEQPVAFAHIDSDWYDSVMICLERIEPHLVSGGILIIDDYNDWEGCKRAVDEYFDDKKEEYQFLNRSRLHIVRK